LQSDEAVVNVEAAFPAHDVSAELVEQTDGLLQHVVELA
jgi:hypothetical protein